MTIEKLKSGSYRITQMQNGVRYRATIDHKPKKGEAEAIIAEEMLRKGAILTEKGAVSEQAIKYLSECEKRSLSPSTMASYRSIVKNTPAWFLDMDISKVNVCSVQKMVDQYAKNHSPKSVANISGFYASVFADLRLFDARMIKLPKKQKKAEYEPTTKDIQRILEEATGSRYECVINLMVLGLRRGEASAITVDDLTEDNVLTIDKDIVYDGSHFVPKDHPKTEASYRRILVPEDVAVLIRKNGKAFEGNLDLIYKYLQRTQEKLDIPRFRPHILRHYAAAYLHKEGFTDKQIMSYMGWSTISTMHNVYNYNLDPEESQATIASAFKKLRG